MNSGAASEAYAQWLRALPERSTRPLSDGIIITNYSLGPGGSERQIVYTVRGLVRRGYKNVTVACQDLSSYPTADFFGPELRALGASVVTLHTHCAEEIEVDALPDGLPALLFPEVKTLYRLFCRLRPVAIYGWQDLLGVETALAAAAAGVPRIAVTTRTLSPPHYGHLDSRYALLRGAFQALADDRRVVLVNNSAAGAADYNAWLGLGRDVFGVHLNAFCPDFDDRSTEVDAAAYRRRLGLPAGVPVLGGIMRLYEEKDPLLFVRTAAAIAARRSDVQFLLVGDGPQRAEVQQAIDKLGLAPRFFLPGTEPSPALPLSVMDVFLLTSRIEGLPNVLLEAQWHGVPAIAPAVGGTGEIVSSGKTGWIVAEPTPELLADRVLTALANAAWRAEVRRIAPERILREFSVQAMIDRTVAMLGLHEIDPLSASR